MKNFKNPAKFIISFLLLTLLHVNVHADTLTTPFRLELSPESTATLLGGVNHFTVPGGVFSTDLPNQNLTDPYAVAISGLHLALQYSFKKPTKGQDINEWNIQSDQVSADLVVDSINASQIVTQQSGGATINIRVNAVCKNVKLSLTPGATSVSATVGISLEQNHADFQLKNFNASWTPSAWTIASLDCQGPQGFAELVRQNVETQLRSIDPFLPSIQTQIQNSLTAASGQAIAWTLASQDQSGVSFTLSASTLEAQASGSTLVTGIASFQFAKLNGTACQQNIELPATTTVVNDALEQDALSVPVKAITGLLSCAYLNGALTTTFTNQQFPAFQQLLGNYFLKAFVWPHLVKFNRSSIFNFKLSLTKAPDFGSISPTPTGDFSFPVDSALQLSVFAPNPQGQVHAVDFDTSIAGPAVLSVKNSVLSFTENNGGLAILKHWDEQYLADYRPCQKIRTRVIGKYLSNFLVTTGLNFPLPIFNAAGFTLTIDSAQLRGDVARVKLKIRDVSQASPLK